MYPYHNRLKQRIRAGELAGYEFVAHYPRIGEALVLYFFTDPPVRPVRPHRKVMPLSGERRLGIQPCLHG